MPVLDSNENNLDWFQFRSLNIKGLDAAFAISLTLYFNHLNWNWYKTLVARVAHIWSKLPTIEKWIPGINRSNKNPNFESSLDFQFSKKENSMKKYRLRLVAYFESKLKVHRNLLHAVRCKQLLNYLSQVVQRKVVLMLMLYQRNRRYYAQSFHEPTTYWRQNFWTSPFLIQHRRLYRNQKGQLSTPTKYHQKVFMGIKDFLSRRIETLTMLLTISMIQ